VERQKLLIRIWCCVDKMTVYVSDPKMWEQAFNDLSSEKINPYNYYRAPQTGRGLGGRYSSTFHVPVKAPEKIVLSIEQITPMAAVAERAKSDLKRKMEDGLPHVILIQFRWTGNNSLTHSLIHSLDGIKSTIIQENPHSKCVRQLWRFVASSAIKTCQVKTTCSDTRN
jgi:hypothetical protein